MEKPLQRKGASGMRIEAYNQIQQLYKSQKVSKTQQAGKVGRADQLQLSSLGKDIQTTKAAVSASADIRQDVIGPIKEQIANGTYQVDTASFAAKLMEKYAEMG